MQSFLKESGDIRFELQRHISLANGNIATERTICYHALDTHYTENDIFDTSGNKTVPTTYLYGAAVKDCPTYSSVESVNSINYVNFPMFKRVGFTPGK